MDLNGMHQVNSLKNGNQNSNNQNLTNGTIKVPGVEIKQIQHKTKKTNGGNSSNNNANKKIDIKNNMLSNNNNSSNIEGNNNNAKYGRNNDNNNINSFCQKILVIFS